MNRPLSIVLCLFLSGGCLAGPIVVEFELDATAQWADALTNGQLTAVGSWGFYRIATRSSCLRIKSRLKEYCSRNA